MTPERRDDDSREPDEIDSMLDEFGDRGGPDPAREPELELGDEQQIVEPAPDDDERAAGA